MSLIVPQFLQQYDKRLKSSSPILWATRFHFVLFYVILAYLSTVLFSCWSFESSWSYQLSKKLWPFILVGLAAWIIATKNIDSRIDYQLRLRWSKVRTYFVYWFCASLIIALPFALRQTHSHLVQKQLNPIAMVFDWVHPAQAQNNPITASENFNNEELNRFNPEEDLSLLAYTPVHSANEWTNSLSSSSLQIESHPEEAQTSNVDLQPIVVSTQASLYDLNESAKPTWNQALPFSGNEIWSKVLFLDIGGISNSFESILFGAYQNEFPWIPVLFIGFCISLVIQILLSIGWSGFLVSIGVQLFLITCSIITVQYLNTVLPGTDWNILTLLTLLFIYAIGIYISFFVKRARNNWHMKAFGVISFALLSPVVICLLFMLKGYVNISFIDQLNYNWAWVAGIVFYMCLFPIVNNLLLRLKGAYE
jgi:hypothetical protein